MRFTQFINWHWMNFMSLSWEWNCANVSEDLVITGNWLNHMWAIRYNEVLCIAFKPLPHINNLYLVILGVKKLNEYANNCDR